MRYDILYTTHIPGIGEVRLYFDTIRIRGYKTYISGIDKNNRQIDFICDKFVYPENRHTDYGYCHITSYTTQGNTVRCSLYKSIY